VTRSVFGDLTVVANRSEAVYDGIEPHGFRATAGDVTAQAYPGEHWLIEERSGGTTTVRQPVGGDFTVTVPGSSVTTSTGTSVPFTAASGKVTFTYTAGVDAYVVR
jgi:hypothetical protein